jgi:hypothetical protein
VFALLVYSLFLDKTASIIILNLTGSYSFGLFLFCVLSLCFRMGWRDCQSARVCQCVRHFSRSALSRRSDAGKESFRCCRVCVLSLLSARARLLAAQPAARHPRPRHRRHLRRRPLLRSRRLPRKNKEQHIVLNLTLSLPRSEGLETECQVIVVFWCCCCFE